MISIRFVVIPNIYLYHKILLKLFNCIIMIDQINIATSLNLLKALCHFTNLGRFIDCKSNADEIFGSSLISGIRASGLASFQLADIDISISKLRVEALLQIPQIAASADHYFLDGVVASILPIFGDGAADLTIDNINITFAASLTTLNGTECWLHQKGTVILHITDLHSHYYTIIFEFDASFLW